MVESTDGIYSETEGKYFEVLRILNIDLKGTQANNQ